MSDTHQRPETLVLHAGWRADPTTGSVAVPIHQTTSYQFRDTGHAASLLPPRLSYLPGRKGAVFKQPEP